MQNHPTKALHHFNWIDPKIRFWSYVKKTPTCWLWVGGKFNDGYGSFSFSVRNRMRSHRFSWILHKGEIPKKMCICHHCDIPLCIRPSHLFLGTHADNMADMSKKGHRIGERNPKAQLKKEDVAEIRFLYKPQWGGILSKIYGVTRANIYQIVKRKSWKHI